MSPWPTSTVGDVTLTVTKGTTPTTIGARFIDEGVSFVKVESLSTDGNINHAKVAFINDATNQLLKRSILAADDILFSIAGTIGRVAQVRESDLPANTNQAVAVVRPDPAVIDSRFLFYCLRDGARVDRARSRVVQSVQANLSLAELSSVEVPLPAIAVQREIAATLGALDDKIESNRRIAQLVVSWVDARAGVLISSVPTHSVQLSEVVEFNRLSIRPGADTDPLLYLDIASVSPGKIDEFRSINWADAPSRARRGVSDGDVIYSTVRPGRRSFALLLEPSPDTVASTGFAVMSPMPSLGSSLLTSVVGSAEFASYLESVAQGSAYPAVSVEAMSRYTLQVPDDQADLARFEAETMPMRRRAQLAENENRRLSLLRDTLLPELLSGRLSVARALGQFEAAVE